MIRSAHGLLVNIYFHGSIIKCSSRLNRWRAALQSLPQPAYHDNDNNFIWQGLNRKFKISPAQKRALLLDFVEICSIEETFLPKLLPAAYDTLIDAYVVTDACNYQIGGFISSVFAPSQFQFDKIAVCFSMLIPEELFGTSIDFKELITPMILILFWVIRSDLTGVSLHVGLDNVSAVCALSKRSAKAAMMAAATRAFYSILDNRQIRLLTFHIPGVVNECADQISRATSVYDWLPEEYSYLLLPPHIVSAVFSVLLLQTFHCLDNSTSTADQQLVNFRKRIFSEHSSCSCLTHETCISKTQFISKFLDELLVEPPATADNFKSLAEFKKAGDIQFAHVKSAINKFSECMFNRPSTAFPPSVRQIEGANEAISLVESFALGDSVDGHESGMACSAHSLHSSVVDIVRSQE